MEQNEISQSEVSVPNTTTKIEIKQSNNPFWMLLTVVLVAAIYIFLLIWAYICIPRYWYFVTMVFVGGLTPLYPMYKFKEVITKSVNYIGKGISVEKVRRYIKISLNALLLFLLLICIFSIFNEKNPDSKLYAGILLYLLSGLFTSLLTYNINKWS